MSEGTVRQSPRHVPMTHAWIEISAGMDNILRVLDISWYEALYHVGRVKLQLLREMGVEYPDPLPVENIPDAEHVISSAFYQPMLTHHLTQRELYSLIIKWLDREAIGMVQDERKSDEQY